MNKIKMFIEKNDECFTCKKVVSKEYIHYPNWNFWNGQFKECNNCRDEREKEEEISIKKWKCWWCSKHMVSRFKYKCWCKSPCRLFCSRSCIDKSEKSKISFYKIDKIEDNE